MTDFSKTLIHCSSIGKLLTEPQLKADKEAGELSKTAKTHLIEVYANVKYDFKKDIDNKYTDKGNTVESDAIELLSLTIKRPLEKNTVTFKNDFFVGTPDVIDNNIIYDTKSSWDWITFLTKIVDKLDSDYEAQLNGYMDLLGLDYAFIAYCLLDTPEHIRESMKYGLLRKMNVISEESPEFIEEWEEKEKNMIFSNHPMSERILLFPVIRNNDLIEKAKIKTEKARLFLQELEHKHLNFNSK